MYVVIVGAGEVGSYLAKILVQEGHDVAVVEADESASRALESELDCLVVHGSGVNRQSLIQAGIKRADLVIGVTTVDEVNLVSCMVASKVGDNPRTVARVREVEHYLAGAIEPEDMGLSLLVGPEQSVAEQVVRQLSFEGAGEIRSLAGDRLLLLELPLSPDSPMCHETLAELASTFPEPSLVAGITGEKGLRIPRGDDTLNADERVEILTTEENIDEFLILSGQPWHHVRHVLIVGGGSIGYRLARELEKKRIYPTIIERDKERAEWLSGKLSKALILQGDGADPSQLREQLEEVADAVVVLLPDNEKAVLVGLMARHYGAKKVIVRSDTLEYAPIAHKMGVDSLISPRRSLANSILHFIRTGHVATATMLGDNEGEILELHIPDEPQNSRLVGTPLMELDFPRDSLVGGVLRGEQVIIPDGQTTFEPGDTLLVIALPKAIAQVEKMVR